jgi:photosystem II stability/assembly factor-like uncharacterized protein
MRTRSTPTRAVIVAAAAFAMAGLSPVASASPAEQNSSPTTTSHAPESLRPSSQEHLVPFTAVDFSNMRDGWVGSKGFILATTDGGRHWSAQHAGSGYVLGLDFVGRETGWALPAKTPPQPALPQASDGLYGTTDGGRHWRLLSSTRLLGVDFLDRTSGWGVQYLTTPAPDHTFLPPEGRLAKTNDGGRSWTHPSHSAQAQSVCFSGLRHGWTANHNSVFQTNDGGATWRRVFHPGLKGPQAWFATVHCARDTAWVLFAATEDGAGDQEPYIAYRHSRHAWTRLFDEGYFPSYPRRGRTTQGPGNYAGPFVVVGPDTGYFAGYNMGQTHGQPANGGEFMGTNDGGAKWRWRVLAVLDPSEPVDISFVNRERGWMVGTGVRTHKGQIFTTTDGGVMWRREYPRF